MDSIDVGNKTKKMHIKTNFKIPRVCVCLNLPARIVFCAKAYPSGTLKRKKYPKLEDFFVQNKPPKNATV